MQNGTKNVMKASLKKLIQNAPLSKITISDIAADCGISRMTFYYHFDDIYDLVEWSVLSDAQESSRGHVSTDTWENELASIFKIAYLNKDFYLALFNSMDRALAEKYLLRYTQKVATRIVAENINVAAATEENKARFAEYYSYAMMGVISCWVSTGMQENPMHIAKSLCNLIKSGIVASIKTDDD